ncbi:MAG: LysR family transcriptional regulator [Adlercreutzia caecimuris]|jgi:DNA-binding transcriptional LysR family regulator|uniref:helix-turn-helix domain-containing protein n=1 Tax=Adlercreutzia caecimuris TaxID=671266 RepID=UPI00242FF454|nr:LysR family transcriptional regulator [Adlercreutzia caecimuris]MCI9207003.1 LysR family transcriptional regulator [Adlercreutzia caecimuris]
MNENQMQSFAAAVEQGSMSKAARDQFLTVPSLVHRINTLEAELGYRVLDRGQQGVTPHTGGRAPLPRCQAGAVHPRRCKG